MSKRIAILGGGVSGLTAGIYAQKHGFETEIYDMNSVPGGECTGWDRKGFHIDGCIHWLTGSREDNDLGRIWREIGALGPDVDIYRPDSFCTVNYEGTTVTLYSDLNKLQSHLTDISPEDKSEIGKLCGAIGRMADSGIPMVPPEMMNPLDLIKLILKMSSAIKVIRTFKMSLEDYVTRFRSPALRAALVTVLPLKGTASVLPYTLGTICYGNGGRPAGGSRAMALRMAAKYKSMGGRLYLNKEVSKITVENGKATGVLFSDGSAVTADYIVPATDIHTTLDKFLEGKYHIPQIDERDANHKAYPSPTCVYAAFSIDEDISDIPPDYTFTSSLYTFEDKKLRIVNFKHYCYEPSFAPACFTNSHTPCSDMNL